MLRKDAGVCYAVADQTSQFYMIQRWPGSDGASADKASDPFAYQTYNESYATRLKESC